MATKPWDFFERINISILLTSKAHNKTFTWTVFNAHGLVIFTAVKRTTRCACFLCLTSEAKEGVLIERGGLVLNFGMVTGLERERA